MIELNRTMTPRLRDLFSEVDTHVRRLQPSFANPTSKMCFSGFGSNTESSSCVM